MLLVVLEYDLLDCLEGAVFPLPSKRGLHAFLVLLLPAVAAATAVVTVGTDGLAPVV
jgi:hypothetical protein